MKIAVVCANGKAGRLIVKEAVSRGHEVTAFARSANQTVSQDFRQKDLFDLTAADLQGFDAVVDAFGAWQEQDLHLHSDSLKHLCKVLSGSDTRLYVVGGAGSLFVNKEHSAQVSDSPDFPAMFLPLARAQGKSLEELRAVTDVNWIFVSPACDFRADGARSGKYVLAGEELSVNDKGESIISYADYAIGMVDLIEQGGHNKERVSLRGA